MRAVTRRARQNWLTPDDPISKIRAASLMRDQERYGRIAQQRPGDAAENHLSGSRVTVGADHHEIGRVLLGVVQNGAGDALAMRRRPRDDNLDAVTAEVLRDIRAGLLAVAGILLGIDREDRD